MMPMSEPASVAAIAAAPPNLNVETVLRVQHWNDDLFSIVTTRDAGFRFDNGQFVMLGLMVDGKPLMRAYSVASPNWAETLEFFSIKIADGALTSRLQHLQPGDQILLSRKPTGTLLIDDLHPGRCLYLLGTGTGLAPFLSIVQDPATYERFETVVVAHGVREIADLAYRRLLSEDLAQHEYLGPMVQRQLRYYPAVSREPHPHQGRLTTLFEKGRINGDLGLPEIDPKHDRVMLCGSPAMLADFRELLDARGFQVTQRIGALGDYVYERAFVEK